jgi:parvulin-like peptidyl-prolyl isomerase
MKKTRLVLVVAALAAGWAGVSAAQPRLVDGVVAVVGREPILQSDLLQDIGPQIQNIRKTAVSQEQFAAEVDKALEQALEAAIEYHILYREAVAAGIEVKDDDVESRLGAIRRQYETGEAFAAALAEAGTTVSEFRERVRRQIMASVVAMGKRTQFEKEVAVTEEEISRHYEDHKADFEHPARMRVRRIFIPAAAEAAARAQARARLETLRGELDLGADFAEIARAHSEGPEAGEGGLAGWVKAGDMVAELDTVLSGLKPGEISGVVETEFGFHLLKVEAREDAGTTPYDKARQEIEPLLRKQRVDERYKKWMGTLRQRGSVRVFN